MMWTIPLLLVLAATFAPVSAVGAPPASPRGTSPSAPPPTADEQDEAVQRYLHGRWYESNGDRERALDEYLHALAANPGSVELMLRLSELLSSAGDAGRALEFADRALKSAPDEPRAHWLRGAALFNLGRPKDALTALQRAVEGDTTNVEYWRTLARVAEQEDRADLLLRAWNRVTQEEADDGEAWFQLAAIQARLGRFGAADTAMQEALELNPARPGLFFLNGWIHEGLGDSDGAITLYQHHLAVYARDATTRRRLIVLLEQRGRAKEALAEAEKLVAARPEDPEALALHAEAAFTAKRVGDARASLARLRALAPDDPQLVERSAAMLSRHGLAAEGARLADEWSRAHPGDLRGAMLAARARAFSGDVDGAVDRARAAVASAPDSVGPRRLLARILQDAKRWEDARRELEGLVQRMPRDVGLRLDLAACLEEGGDSKAAEAAARDALGVAPGHAPALNFLGYLLAEQNRGLDEARKLVEKAVEQDPDNGAYVDSMGWVYFRLGRLEDARQALERALVLTGGDPVIHEHLGDVYRALSRPDQAREQYRLSLADDDNARVRNKLSDLK